MKKIMVPFIFFITIFVSAAEGSDQSIFVVGNGQVIGVSDTASITVSFKNVNTTTREALNSVNEKIAATMKVADELEIERRYIRTTNFRIAPYYERVDNKRVFRGYEVIQRVSITIHNIDQNENKMGLLIDRVVDNEGLELDSLNFYIEDKEELYTTARERAYSDALKKAQEYASLAGLILGPPIEIKEMSRYNPPFPPVAMSAEALNGVRSSVPEFPVGEEAISLQIEVKFSFFSSP